MKKEHYVKEEKFIRKPIERTAVSYKEGLSNILVQERMEKGWTNRAVESPEKTNGQIVKDNIVTYFNLIFLVLSLLLIIAGSYRSLTFLPIIIANTLIGIIQEIRAKNVLSKMKMLHTPYTCVIRNGKKIKVPSEELVIDDIAVFSAGNQICADAEVVHGEARVNEALLTGESDEVVKTVGNHLMSGSMVTSGECFARLCHVGEDSYISRLTIEAKRIDHKEQSEMIASINELVLFVGIAIIPIGIALFLQSYLYQKTGFSESIVSMVAAVIGMIPEGLYLLATIAMAVSAVRLAQNQVLLHDMKSIETLARVNVLCVDKTGTITKNEMEICELINPIRDNAKQTFQYFTEQGVRIKVISGDNPLTVSRIANEAGINGSQNYIDATKLKSSQQLADALKKYTVFGRVTPEQKRKIVQCLQKSGNTVAMTGDGVNDVLEYGTCRQRVNPLYYCV